MTALPTLAAAAALLLAPAGSTGDDVALRAMKDELHRTMAELQLPGMDRPYFVAYRMEDVRTTRATASLGALTGSQEPRSRRLEVELRVGSHELDDGNFAGSPGFSRGGGSTWAPLDDDYREIRRQLWRATDARYKAAVEALTAKRAALAAQRRGEPLPDFSRREPVAVAGPARSTGAGKEPLEALARELSAVFRAHPEIHRSSVRIEARDRLTRYVNSEGSAFTRHSPIVHLHVEAETRADDGMPLADALDVRAATLAELPPPAELVARTRALALGMVRLRAADTLERYVGPVLFEDVAAPEVFLQQFATALVAVRPPVSDDPARDAVFLQMITQLGGGSFADKLGGRVLPDLLGVADRPSLAEVGGVPLLGGQPVDDEGVVPRDVQLVQRGILKTLLTTRVPVRRLRESTGSRRGPGAAPSNLLVTPAVATPAAALRKALLERAEARGLPWAVVVRRVGANGARGALARAASTSGGALPPAAMAEVIRLHPDGREEPLRGVELADLGTIGFREIAAAGERPAVVHGEFQNLLAAMFAGGEPSFEGAPVVSCVAPALLFDEVGLAGTRGPFPAAFATTPPAP